MKLTKNKKIIYSVLVILFILFIAYKGPTFARYNNRGASFDNVWSGRASSSFRSGTGLIDDPYIISNGEELAYLSSTLSNNNYENKYFKLLNDIVLNEGVFSYSNDTLYYEINSTRYVVNANKYYDENTMDEVGTLNILDSLDGFEGIIDFNYHVIYGYYNDEALFKNLSGNVSSLYIENAVVKSNGDASIFADAISTSTVKNIVVDGIIISDEFDDGGLTLDNLTILSNYNNHTNSLIGGIAIYADDATIMNVINKSNIYGGYLSSGLIAYAENSSIINGYSTGNIDSYVSTTIGVFKGTGSIEKVYNTGNINSSLVGYFIDANVNISNSFIVTNNRLLTDSSSSTVTSTNNYYTYTGMGNNITSTETTTSNLKDKTFLTNYSEYVDKTDLLINPLNVWLFNEGDYPVLYFDDVINERAELHINTFMWNSYSILLNEKKLTGNITFMISDTDNTHITRKYYYVSDDDTLLTNDELIDVNWIEYSGIETITTEGTYIIYVKTIDNNDNVRYINSDIMVLDNSGPEVTITMGDNSYNSQTSGELYTSHSFNLSISSEDELTDAVSLEYYLSNTELNDLSGVIWNTYSSNINVNSIGEYKLYVKSTNGVGLITYASTPLIIYDGYQVSNLKPVGFDSGNNITKSSSIMFDITYSNNRSLNITHNLVSNTALPLNTKITLMDKTNNGIYEYVVSSSTTTYPLSSFNKLGINTTTYYSNNSVTNENYTVVLDFSNCEIISDYSNVKVYLEGINNGNVIRPTITKQGFNIISNDNGASHSLSTDFNSNITYNTNSTNTVNITNTISMSNNVYDTSLRDKKIGLIIKLVNSSGNTMSKDYLKNISFKIGNTSYAPGNDNVIRISLNRNSTTNTALIISTYQGAHSLEAGTYYIKINGFISNDGLYYENGSLTNAIRIPLVVNASNENTDTNYSFDVLVDSNNRIIEKGTTASLSFRALEIGLTNPNIRVSLYKKKELTAFNQEYILLNLQDHTSATLDEASTNIYYVTRNAVSFTNNSSYNTFNLSLNTTNLDKTSYKFVFDLYDGNIKVESVEKYIIIK